MGGFFANHLHKALFRGSWIFWSVDFLAGTLSQDPLREEEQRVVDNTPIITMW